MSAAQRAKEFGDEMIVFSAWKLFFLLYPEELLFKLSIVKNHVQLSKYTHDQKQLAEKRSRECNTCILQVFKPYEQEVHPCGDTLSDDNKVRRMKVVTTFKKAGVPLAKIDHF